jgi:probable F420-dependent oxidoreductase
MSRFKVGVQLQPQHVAMPTLRAAAQAADGMGVDSIWTWDHFYPLYGEPDGTHFEGWTTLTAIAADTSQAMVGTLVTGNSYRNSELLADMARTVDHISGGRAYLGIGAGWFERDYAEYGYEFGTAGTRLRALEASLVRIRARLDRLHPRPVGRFPILVGGGGEKVTLRLVATYADAWNGFGPAETFAHKSAVLDRWCAEVGRDPAEIERTISISGPVDPAAVDAAVAAGADHLILMQGAEGGEFDLADLQRLLDLR